MIQLKGCPEAIRRIKIRAGLERFDRLVTVNNHTCPVICLFALGMTEKCAQYMWILQQLPLGMPIFFCVTNVCLSFVSYWQLLSKTVCISPRNSCDVIISSVFSADKFINFCVLIDFLVEKQSFVSHHFWSSICEWTKTVVSISEIVSLGIEKPFLVSPVA